MNYTALLDTLTDHRVFIQTHNMPDPDAIAAGYGLQQFLKNYGIESEICHIGSLDRQSTIDMTETLGIRLINAETITDMTESDYIVLIDGQKNNVNLTDLPGREVACIDHHPIFAEYDCEYKDIRICGACSSIITEYYITSGLEIPPDVATALLFGIKIDTDNFTRGTTPLDIKAFDYLLPFSDTERLNSLGKSTMRIDDLKAYGAAIKSIRQVKNICFAYIPFNCPDALIGMVSDFILDLNEINFSVIYALRKDGVKFSVRSSLSALDAGKITEASLFGLGNGGGHASMAGGFVPIESFKKLSSNLKIRRRRLERLFIREINKAACENALHTEKQTDIFSADD